MAAISAQGVSTTEHPHRYIRRTLGSKMDTSGTPRDDAPAAPRGFNRTPMTLYLSWAFSANFIKTVEVPMGEGIEHFEQYMEAGYITPRLKLDPLRAETHHRYYQLFLAGYGA